MSLDYILINILETLLRFLPVPCKTGLVRVGNPGPQAPVLVTGNYHLTVLRLKRALRGLDAHVLVANSRGINVWCAAAGGHFTHHQVISALKTSGLENLVNHRTVILPPLAATGVEAAAVRQKAGFEVKWGPVYATDLPEYLKNGGLKTPRMREVEFSLQQRLEMAGMWAFPFFVLAVPAAWAWWPKMVVPLAVLLWVLPLLVFVLFPRYERWLRPRPGAARPGWPGALWEFIRVPLVMWGLCLLGLAAAGLAGIFRPGFFWLWGLTCLVILMFIGLDLKGSTPVYKSATHPDHEFQVVLDREKCRTAGACEQVCPRNCFEVDYDRRRTLMPRAGRCVQCGACIVQCPHDALAFRDSRGRRIPPETVRTYKLNLLGTRQKPV